LIFCGHCSGVESQTNTRLWMTGSGKRWMHCPRRAKGLCSMGCWVNVNLAEQKLIEFVQALLTSWPDWLQTVVERVRAKVAAASDRVPVELKAKNKQFAKLEKEIDNLVRALAGGIESSSVRNLLHELESQRDELRTQIVHEQQLMTTPATMPEDSWIKTQLG